MFLMLLYTYNEALTTSEGLDMLTNFALLDFGAPELIIILVILLLLFGSKKLPELSKSVGDSMRELRKGINGDDKEESKPKSEASSDKKTVS